MPQRIRANLLVWVGLFHGLCCIGCARSSLVPAQSTWLSSASAEAPDVSKPDRGELPPKETARACMVAAEELQNNGYVQQAILLYEKARANDPSLKSVSHRLAVLRDAQGDSTQSLIEYKRALQADPKNASLLSDLGYYHYARGNLAEAEQCLRSALTVDPNHQKAISNLALVLAADGRFDESFAAFSRVIGPAAAHSNLGVLMAKQGRYDQAKQAFHQALTVDPTLAQPKAFLHYLENPQSARCAPELSACLTSPVGVTEDGESPKSSDTRRTTRR